MAHVIGTEKMGRTWMRERDTRLCGVSAGDDRRGDCHDEHERDETKTDLGRPRQRITDASTGRRGHESPRIIDRRSMIGVRRSAKRLAVITVTASAKKTP